MTCIERRVEDVIWRLQGSLPLPLPMLDDPDDADDEGVWNGGLISLGLQGIDDSVDVVTQWE